jgi:N6-L-threonylcarbamoyladenine synthase
LTQANLDIQDIDAIAAAGGPGLIGGVIIGVTAAKAIALATINLHSRQSSGSSCTDGALIEEIDFPFMALLLSGGHTQLVAVKAIGNYQRIGSTSNM